ncbi:hypothetical protein C0Q70_05947 [Pomacea canaliculata]|uniref:Uncharacterized protein n=1 Tax=Pomacea canaliculata TaxID=400727 RepID=A0A2T7PMM2_POMCA|nr:hypothetical protein C0Q70_05947 [Pomacea canaliculata]
MNQERTETEAQPVPRPTEKEGLSAKYWEANRQVKRSAREDKRRFTHKLTEEAETAATQGNMKRLYEITRILSDTAQLLVFIRGTNSDFELTEELAAMRGMHGNTTGEDLFKEVSAVIEGLALPWEKIGGGLPMVPEVWLDATADWHQGLLEKVDVMKREGRGAKESSYF